MNEINATPVTTPSPTPDPTPDPAKKKQRPKALADTLRDWDSLLGAVADNASELSMVEPFRAALATTLAKARQVKDAQDSHQASRQSLTRSLKEIVQEGQEQAISLRAAVRAVLGPATTELVQFKIRPLVRRARATHIPDPAPTPATQKEVASTGKAGA
jgi:hypothetical protein